MNTSNIVLNQSSHHLNFWETSSHLVAMGANGTIETKAPLPVVLFVTSFPPRECGIATYSQDLINTLNIQFANSFTCGICALESETEQHNYKEQPQFILNTDEHNAFVKTAFQINKDENIKLVVIQHEFGFFAGHENDFKLFFEYITKPIVFVFHTVLPQPNVAMTRKVKAMADIASSIVVMTTSAANILMKDYDVPCYLITVIPHGTHLVPTVNKKKVKEHYQLTNKKVLSTFGLLGSSKSIETTLDALPEVIKIHGDVMFLVLGKTHPNIVKHDGEIYRTMLEQKVKDLKLEQHVRFVNEYLQLPVLLEYLLLSDIYLFTSKDPNQAVSGTFSYAVSSGCPVISTPIPHAKEVLKNNNGIIIDFENSAQLSQAIISLLNNEQLRAEISSNSFHKMASTAWQNSAIAHALLFDDLTANAITLQYRVPAINLNHIKQSTTNFGMIQFSKIAVPDIHSGYTLDDNARALIATCQHYQLFKDENDLTLIHTYLNFIAYCVQPNGMFLNYVNEQKEFTSQNDIENLDDSQGRAIWALGYASSLKNVLPQHMITKAENKLQVALLHVDTIHSTRAMAFIIKGLYYRNSAENHAQLVTFANRLVQMYKHEKTDDWHWYENYLTYGNSLLPEAMLCAHIATKNNVYKIVAQESFQFLLSKIFVNGRIKVISNKGWCIKNSDSAMPVGGEQPIDVAYTIMALEKFYIAFKKADYKKKANKAFNWFLGDNHLNQIVYNPCTGGSYDGVEEHNINLNQGAESTLSYLLARLSVERMNEADKSYSKTIIGIAPTAKAMANSFAIESIH